MAYSTTDAPQTLLRPTLVVPLLRQRRVQSLLPLCLHDWVRVGAILHYGYSSRIHGPVTPVSLHRAPRAEIDVKSASKCAQDHDVPHPLRRHLHSPSLRSSAAVRRLLPATLRARRCRGGRESFEVNLCQKGEVVETGIGFIILYRG